MTETTPVVLARQAFPEHRHIIVDNCVWPLGMDTKGNLLEGAHELDDESDLLVVRDDIMAALRHESIAAMCGLMDAGGSDRGARFQGVWLYTNSKHSTAKD